MQVVVNGTRKEVPPGMNLSQLLDQLKVQPERVAVEVNLKIIHRQQYGQVLLNEGDQIEIIGFVGGGRSCR
jgi:thiamine biosynthesis protein ThiS